MKLLGLVVVLAGLAVSTCTAKAQSAKEQFVGKSACAPETQPDKSIFSLRLDKTQNTTLFYRDLSASKVALIIQAKASPDVCGVILDAVQTKRTVKNFEFRCFDPRAPTDVILGTAIRNETTPNLVMAIDAWRIDLKAQKFIPDHNKVVCSADGFDGEDEGGDMVDSAKEYAAHHKPGRVAQPLRRF